MRTFHGIPIAVLGDISTVSLQNSAELWAERLFYRPRKNMYANSDSSVQVNGHIAGPIPIQCSIRQGRPMSMVLFALCINPLLKFLDQNLTVIRLGRSDQRTAVVAHADGVTIFDEDR
jgi:hypothetical protein